MKKVFLMLLIMLIAVMFSCGRVSDATKISDQIEGIVLYEYTNRHVDSSGFIKNTRRDSVCIEVVWIFSGKIRSTLNKLGPGQIMSIPNLIPEYGLVVLDGFHVSKTDGKRMGFLKFKKT